MFVFRSEAWCVVHKGHCITALEFEKSLACFKINQLPDREPPYDMDG